MTYQINCVGPGEVLFQNILEEPAVLDTSDFLSVFYIVPYTEDSETTRLKSKAYRASYGVDKFQVIDVDMTYPAYKNIAKRGEQQTTENIVSELIALDYFDENGQIRDFS